MALCKSEAAVVNASSFLGAAGVFSAEVKVAVDVLSLFASA